MFGLINDLFEKTEIRKVVMKKLLIISVFFIVLVMLGLYTKQLFNQQGKSDTELIDFAIADTNSVDKIIISDAFANTMELIRKGKRWFAADGSCVTQENIQFILEAFKNIEFKGYLPDNSQDQFTKIMSSQHVKVSIYQEGDWTKTWYIGPASQDHYGQIMLLDSKEYGKSSLPVMMKIKGVNGIIEPRFFADQRKWRCTQIFALPIDRIAKVNVQFFDDPTLSFSVTKKGNFMQVYQQGRMLKDVAPSMIFRYLQNFKKVHFNLVNFELNDKQVDSLKRSMPFAKMTVRETNGFSTKLRMFRIKSDENQTNEFGEIVNMDMNLFWCELPSGELVKCQYYVFNPLLLGHVYFPLDLTKRKNAKQTGFVQK